MTSFGNLFATAALAFAIAFGSTIRAEVVDGTESPGQATGGTSTQYWSAWGGTIGVRWNRDLAGDLGMQIPQPVGQLEGTSWNGHDQFDLRQAGSLDFTVERGNLQNFVGGSVQARGGYSIETSSGLIDLRDFRLRTRTGDPLVLDLVGADGKAWFYVDRLMYELVDDNQVLAVRSMDLRISMELAQRIGHPEVGGWAIAGLEMSTEVLRQGASVEVPDGGGVYDWSGTPVAGQPAGTVFQADLFMEVFTPQYSRCNGCTGISPNSEVVFTPSSTLRNNKNNGSAVATIPGDPLGTSTALWTADIPWYQKFSENSPPYSNDQHPYLIWNMYRVNADGSIDQIGRSGAKHAYLTTNTGCAPGHGEDSHVLGRECGDTYGTGDNDNNNALGPRSEIIPATNQWGRCGSIYDTNCDGNPNSSGNTTYSQRLKVAESQIAPSLNPGASYLFESWYLAREDINIYNSMATKSVTPGWTGSVWNIGTGTNYRLGSAFDRWYELATPVSSRQLHDFATSEGNVKIGVKVFDLGGGSWRYDYVVMNFDFARAYTEGSEPNLRVVHNFGFDRFRIATSGGVAISDLRFSDGDVLGANDWPASSANGAVSWSAPVDPAPPANTPAVLNSLNWGMMFHFSFVANAAPQASGMQLHIAQSSGSEELDNLTENILGPVGSDMIFADNFDTVKP